MSKGDLKSSIVQLNLKSNLTDIRFGRLLVYGRDRSREDNSNSFWLCKCDCGNLISVSRPNLIQNHTRSCGCICSPGEKEYKEKQRVRFFDGVSQTESCWIWTKSLDKQGYGIFNDRTLTIKAHRYSYATFNGELKDGLVICHTCHNPKCVNPAHLYQGTQKENMGDLQKKNRKFKLYSEKQNEAIKILTASKVSTYEIAELLNLTPSGVSGSVRRLKNERT